ncbi:hypothetical protein AB1339_13605 [Streptomyces cyaneofuscatus]|uniref:hypothetical protein n=1 Tax=Streptomyces cyaneofuscatus TaxID=66883 RepID=UPI00345DDB48
MALPRHFIVLAESALSRHGDSLPCGRFTPSPGSPQQPGCASAGDMPKVITPPAWRDVWMCPWPSGHGQAVYCAC